MSEKVFVFMADGLEEIEGLTVVDILRRAGIATEMVSVSGSLEVTGSHGIRIGTDRLFGEELLEEGTLFVLPGGMPGTKHLGEHEGLGNLLKEAKRCGKRIAAICAAPTVLGALGLLEGEEAVCYPGNEEKLIGARIGQTPVVVSGQVTTSRGMGTAIPFALELVAQLKGREESDRLAAAIIWK